jgi:hypothetical protein
MSTRFKCAECGQEIAEGEFIALIGEAPPAGMSTPVGRADKILEDIGEIYCKDCLPEQVELNYST